MDISASETRLSRPLAVGQILPHSPSQLIPLSPEFCPHFTESRLRLGEVSGPTQGHLTTSIEE